MSSVKIDTKSRTSLFAYTDHLCKAADTMDSIEVTEMANGDGYDITVQTRGRLQMFQLSKGEGDLLIHLIEKFSKGESHV